MSEAGNGGRREAAASMLKSAGYPDNVPQDGGRPVHFGPNAENASKAPDLYGMPLANGGRARTTGATVESPMTPTGPGGHDVGAAAGGRLRRRGHHSRVQRDPPPMPPDPAMAADPMAGGPAPFKNGGGANKGNPGEGAGGGLGRLRKVGLR